MRHAAEDRDGSSCAEDDGDSGDEPTPHGDGDGDISTACGADALDEYHPGVPAWDQWEVEVGEEIGAMPCQHEDDHPYPLMPCTRDTTCHRPKLLAARAALEACVARPVGKKEIGANASAQKAMQVEWDRLRAKGCLLYTSPSPRD